MLSKKEQEKLKIFNELIEKYGYAEGTKRYIALYPGEGDWVKDEKDKIWEGMTAEEIFEEIKEAKAAGKLAVEHPVRYITEPPFPLEVLQERIEALRRKQLALSYDQEGDTLFVSLGEYPQATTIELDDDVTLQLDSQTEEVVGFSISNFLARLRQQGQVCLPLRAAFILLPEVEESSTP